MSGIVLAVAVIGGVGLFIGLFLGFAGKKFDVPVDPKEIAVREVLPGANCGSCGYPGCDGLAAAIAKGDAPVSACPVGGEAVAQEIASVMGQSVEGTVRKVAFVRCHGDETLTGLRYHYTGPQRCVAAGYAPSGGPKSCRYGCNGFGDCVAVCDYDALHIVNGIAQVYEPNCRDCKKCIEVCPRHLIIEIPAGSGARIACHNPRKGKPVMDACKIGCIGCSKCSKVCPTEAITMEGTLPVIDYDKCTGCRTCVENCPRKCII